MPIVQQGAINTTALIVPDLYVQIVPPQSLSPLSTKDSKSFEISQNHL
jgi:hypothetical protein